MLENQQISIPRKQLEFSNLISVCLQYLIMEAKNSKSTDIVSILTKAIDGINELHSDIPEVEDCNDINAMIFMSKFANISDPVMKRLIVEDIESMLDNENIN